MNRKVVLPAEASGTSEGNIVVLRDPLSEYRVLVLVILTALLATWAAVAWPWATQRISLGNSFALPIPLFALVPLALLAFYLHRVWNERYILCEDYVNHVQGLASLARRSTRLNYIHCKGVEISQGFVQQLLGIGNIVLREVAGGSQSPEMMMQGVRDPHRYKDIIHERIQKKLKADG